MSVTLTPEATDTITRHQPARLSGLDGLRGLAVAAVVVFHLWPRILPGGFIGVSVFFTLSGFLITRGLLTEIGRSGTFGLRSFWARRLRRLWPASAATLALVALVWLGFGWMTRSISLDVIASFLQVANWRFLASGKAYGATELSPVAHFWSLAIEEQLYVAVPVLLWFTRRRRSAMALAFAGLILISLVATVLSGGDAVVVYYSTVTRAAELAAGGLLAVLMHRRATVAVDRAEDHRADRLLGALGGVAIIVLATLTVRTSLGTEAYYHGGLSAIAILSVLAIVGAIRSKPLTRMLSVRPLVWLGAISYGVYLLHWPIRVALTHTGLPGWSQPWITLATTLAVAPISLRLFEDPIRLGRVTLRRFAPWAVGLTAIIVVGSLLGLGRSPATAIDFDAAARILQQRSVESVPPGAAGAPADPNATIGTAARPVRIAMFGDSTAVMLSMGLGFEEPGIKVMFGNAEMGCTIGRGGRIRGDAGVGDDPDRAPVPWEQRCDWTRRWPSTVRFDQGLDIALILTGNWDVAGRRVPALGGRWTIIGDPVHDDWLRSEMAAAVDALHEAGAVRVLWLTLPAIRGTDPSTRVERFNQLVAEVAATRPWMEQPDYAGYLRSLGPDRDPRPDGIHVTMGTTGLVSRDWLNEVILEAARRP